MKIEITITPESANILAAAIVAAVGGGGSPAAASEDKAPVKPKAKEKEKPAPKAFTLDDLRTAATECVNNGKKDKLVALNKESFGVTGISKLAPEQYADALKAYEALAKEPADDEDPTA